MGLFLSLKANFQKRLGVGKIIGVAAEIHKDIYEQ
jgi:hypothetical protein